MFNHFWQPIVLVAIGYAITACSGSQTNADSGKKTKKKADTSTLSDTESSTLTIESGALAGAEATLPPGAAASGTTVSMAKAGEAPAQFSANTNVQTASEPVSVTAKDAAGNDLTELAKPMSIQLPLPAAALSVAIDKLDDNLCVFLKSADSFFVWRRSALKVETQKAKFESKRLGTFQLVYCGAEPLPDFKDAAAGEVAGTASKPIATVTLTAESTTTFASIATHVCVGIATVGTDGVRKFWAINDYTMSTGTALVAKIFQKQDADIAAMADTDAAFMFVALMSKAQACTEAAMIVAAPASALANQFMTYQKTGAAVKKGDIAGTLGDATGPYPLKSVSMKLGRPDAQPTAAAADVKVCFVSQWSGAGGGSIEQSTGFASAGTIGGVAEYKVYYVPGATDATTKYIRAHINSEVCGVENNKGEAAVTATNQVTISTFWNFTTTATLYLVPADIVLDLSAAVQLLTARMCMRFYSPGTSIDGVSEADKRLKALAGLLGATAEKNPYKIFLPYHSANKYDVGYKLVKATEDCYSDIPEKIGKDNVLQPTATIKDANIAR